MATSNAFEYYGGNRGLQTPELRPAIEVALATGLSFMPTGFVDERPGLLTGQSLAIFRCGREMRINADRHVFDDQ
jgi:hypothetical protein